VQGRRTLLARHSLFMSLMKESMLPVDGGSIDFCGMAFVNIFISLRINGNWYVSKQETVMKR